MIFSLNIGFTWLLCNYWKVEVVKFFDYLGLHHSRSLRSKDSNSLEQIDNIFILNPCKNNAECNEDACSPDTSTAVYSDGSFLTKLLLCFMHLSNEIDKSFGRLGYALLRPLGKLELPNCSWLAVSCVSNLKSLKKDCNLALNFQQFFLWFAVSRIIYVP